MEYMYVKKFKNKKIPKKKLPNSCIWYVCNKSIWIKLNDLIYEHVCGKKENNNFLNRKIKCFAYAKRHHRQHYHQHNMAAPGDDKMNHNQRQRNTTNIWLSTKWKEKKKQSTTGTKSFLFCTNTCTHCLPLVVFVGNFWIFHCNT